MARKKIKAGKPDTPDKTEVSPKSSTRAKIKDAEQQIKAITEKGRRKGYLTYKEMNEGLSDEAITPARLDSLLATLDEMGISLLDEADVGKRAGEKFELAEVMA